jgi:glycosyltransferase involved in cell wall biosynthesis
MSRRARVSVVMPFFNLESFLAESIESVLAQTCQDWQLLLIDDGSTDASGSIAKSYAEQYPDRIQYLAHENGVNRGASASRNLGLRHATGDYVALLDGDDIWLPRKLEEQVALLDSMPEAGALYGRTLLWYSWTGASTDRRRDRLQPLGVPARHAAGPAAPAHPRDSRESAPALHVQHHDPAKRGGSSGWVRGSVPPAL